MIRRKIAAIYRYDNVRCLNTALIHLQLCNLIWLTDATAFTILSIKRKFKS